MILNRNVSRMTRRILPLVVLVLGLGTLRAQTPTTAPSQGAFRLAVLPDSQNATQKFPEVFCNTTKYIADNAEKLNIKYVLHVGDGVDTGNDEQQWENYDKAIKNLEGRVPYILAIGNHDYNRMPGKPGTYLFNKYFPRSRLEKMAGFGDTFPEDRNDNSFHTFKAGGYDWLVICVQFGASENTMRWADKLVDEHPKHKVIFLTHSYLEHKGQDVSGKRMWEYHLRRWANLSIVLCGHLSTVHYQSTGDAGNKVCEMLFDWQNPGSPDPNSYFALLEIDTTGQRIGVKTYSATLDKYLTGSREQFEYRDVDFSLREQKTPAQTQPVEPVAATPAKPAAAGSVR